MKKIYEIVATDNKTNAKQEYTIEVVTRPQLTEGEMPMMIVLLLSIFVAVPILAPKGYKILITLIVFIISFSL